MKDVARIGRRFEVKEVPGGHALNYLIPRKLAVIATPESLKRLEEQKLKQAHTVEAEEQRFDEAVKTLEAKPLQIRVEANAQGHLFKGIRAEDIAQAASAVGISINYTQIDIAHPIKQVGEHEIKLVSGAKKATIVLQVIAKE